MAAAVALPSRICAVTRAIVPFRSATRDHPASKPLPQTSSGAVTQKIFARWH